MIRRNIFIGDPHGCSDELRRLLYEADYDKNYDRVIVLGDLLDRGPDSAGVLRLVREMGFECVRGNHEDKYIRYYKHSLKKIENPSYHIPMYFDEEKMGIFSSMREEDLSWLSNLPTFIKVPELNLVAVHAGCLPGRDVTRQAPAVHMYTRYLNKDTYKQMSLGKDFSQPENSVKWNEVYDGNETIIYGHQVNSFSEVLIRTNAFGGRTIGIDTGACFGGNLTAYIFTTENEKVLNEEVVQVKAKKCYSSVKFTVVD